MKNSMRESKSLDNYSRERHIKSPVSPSPTVSASQQGFTLKGCVNCNCKQHPFVEPAKAASVDPLIGKKVATRFEPDGSFIEGDIIEYDPAKDMYKAVYEANTPKEFCDWIDVKKILPHVDWEGLDDISSTVEQNGQDSDNDNAGA